MFCVDYMFDCCLLIELINTLDQNCLCLQCLQDRFQAVVLNLGEKMNMSMMMMMIEMLMIGINDNGRYIEKESNTGWFCGK